MPIAGEYYEFTKANVDVAPAEAGVYVLYDQGEIIYIGRAQGGQTTIKSRLQNHLNGRESPCTQKATHYKWQLSSSPVSLERELLEEFKLYRRTLPRCNERSA